MKNFISILFLSVLFLTSCGKKSSTEAPNDVVQDNYKPPYTVRYEVKFSSSAANNDTQIQYAHEYPAGTWRIASAIGATAYVSNSGLINGWTKEFTVTVDRNPLRIECSVYYNPVTNATYTTKMYVNDHLVKEKTWQRSPSSSTTPSFYNDIYDVY